MGVYERMSIVDKRTVAGNIRDFRQTYELFYYSRVDDLPDKVALYLYLEQEGKEFAKRSLYFSSVEQLKDLVSDLVRAYCLFVEKRNSPDVSLSVYRLVVLDQLLSHVRRRQLGVWRRDGK